jgi:hypothetical protein
VVLTRRSALSVTRYAAVANFTTVTVHRVGVLDLSSLTARIIPVTGTPFKINLAFWPRYWAKRQRRASNGFVISMVCTWHFKNGRGTRNSSATAERI